MRTWHDYVELLCLSVNAGQNGRAVYMARRAVQDAVTILGNERDWNDLLRFFNFATSAEYETGTITYDHTGGANERLVTLASGTWPSWAASGTVLIDDVPYHVEQRLSDTTLTLQTWSNPGEDVASGTSYKIYREHYPLPADCNGVALIDRIDNYDPRYVDPARFHAEKNTTETTGEPRIFTIAPHPVQSDLPSIWLFPAPNTSQAFQTLCRRRPSKLSVLDSNAGTVSVSAGGSAVTGTGTAFTSEMAGGVLRFGDANNIPNSLESPENNYVEEAEILLVNSATSITLAAPVTNTFSGVKHRISSRIPYDAGALETAALACAMWKYTGLMQQDPAERTKAWQEWNAALKAAAFEESNKSFATGGMGAGEMFPIWPIMTFPQYGSDYS